MAENEKKSIFQKLLDSQLYKSIIRSGVPRTRRQRMYAVLGNVFLHLHPARLPRHAVKIGYTWCMGGLSFFIFVVLTITGIMLMFYYRPTVEYAFTDIIDLGEQAPLGIMRELHRWGAHSMVLTVWLHMLRVFMTGSYKPPREFNWAVGTILMTLTMFLSFTGYLLPWDQLAIWAITVGTNMARAHPFIGSEGPGASLLTIGDLNLVTASSDVRYALLGGRFVGEATLLRFYVLHCILVPFIAMIFMAVHFWRIRKDGGISGPL
jgi:quinol-cytochrome oxidoreductase complex cytochrome b subunit